MPDTSPSRRGAATGQPTTKRKRRWLRWTLYTVLGLGLLGIVGVLLAYLFIQPPKPNEIATAQTSIVYYADGQTEMGRISDINRESVPLADIPKPVRYAMLAAEDRNFYEQSGVSPSGIARAVWVAIRGGQATQGGSTITQQYVKNYFLTSDRTISRKAKEILISIKIDRQQTKDQILEDYFNTIYYGRGAYGIQTAARAYFGKDAKDLTLEEGAVLASLVQGPSLYDPSLGEKQLANLKNRFNYVLDGMVSQGWMTKEERAAAQFPMPIEYQPRTVGGTNGYLVQQVKAELESKLKLSPSDIDRGGLRVITTIDQAKQDAAVAAVQKGLPQNVPGEPLHAGLASVVPGDGAIVAMYGGADYAKVQFNTATDATMQAGSTFKIFALIAGLNSGKMSIKNQFNGAGPQNFEEFKDPGAPTQAGRDGQVRNFGNGSFGWMNVEAATASSVNTIFAQINILATPEGTAKAATDAGLTTKVDTNYANVFGTDNVKVIDMANAYATIAAQGLRATPYMVKSVKTTDGVVDYQAKPQTTQVFDPDTMDDVIACMRAVVQYGSGAAAGSIGRPAAGKTGTTTDNYAAWFDGFVPQLGTAVGIYRGDGSVKPENQMNASGENGLGFELTGGTVPTRIWAAYMTKAVQGMPVQQFPGPKYVNPDASPTTGPPPSQEPSAPESTSPSEPAPTDRPSPSEPQPVPPSGPPTGQPTGPPTGPPTSLPTPTLPPIPTRPPNPTRSP